MRKMLLEGRTEGNMSNVSPRNVILNANKSRGVVATRTQSSSHS